MPESEVIESFRGKDDALRLIVGRAAVQIKIELSPVLRGTVFEPNIMPVCVAVENEFGYAETKVVAHADLYAGKICAALDRQHPRDLFDVKGLLDNEGFSDDLRKAVIIFMASHNRPMAELLRPRFKDISALYHGEFLNMSEQHVELTALEATRVHLVALINESLTKLERAFLLSFKNRTPDWSLLELANVEYLPSIRWKQKNLAGMTADKHAEAYQKLKSILVPDEGLNEST